MKADKKAGLAAPWGVAAQTGGEKRVANKVAKQLAAGDPEAFAALYDRLAVRLFNTARTMTDSLPDAEDTVHDVFVELARSRDRLARITDLDAYIFTMLRHAISRRRRRRDRSEEHTSELQSR